MPKIEKIGGSAQPKKVEGDSDSIYKLWDSVESPADESKSSYQLWDSVEPVADKPKSPYSAWDSVEPPVSSSKGNSIPIVAESSDGNGNKGSDESLSDDGITPESGKGDDGGSSQLSREAPEPNPVDNAKPLPDTTENPVDNAKPLPDTTENPVDNAKPLPDTTESSDNPVDNAKPLPDTTEQSNNEAAEAARELAEKRGNIKEALRNEFGDRMNMARSAYADAAAKVWRLGDKTTGSRRRVQAREVASRKLNDVSNQYANELTRRYKEAGLYEGDEEAVKRLVENDMLEAKLGLFEEADNQKYQVLESQEENGGRIRKLAGFVGKWLNSGGKWTRRLKNVGVGFAGGLPVGMLAGAVGFPVTLLVSAAAIGTGNAVYHASRIAKQTDALKVRRESGASTKIDRESLGQITSAQGMKLLARLQAQDHEAFAEVEKDAKKNRSLYRIGWAAGSFAGNFVGHWMSGPDTAGATSGSESSDSTVTGERWEPNPPEQDYQHGYTEGNVVESVDVTPEVTPPQPPAGFEFAPGGGYVNPGDGWYTVFENMGLSPEQGQALFSDPTLMNQLVQQGAAYPDASPLIGGYGVNLPPNGWLSDGAMQLIKNAAQARGF